MRLVAVEVRRFGCVKLAGVEFARGLNILYGPNDIGKSTLVQAIRAGLLLPHSSSAYKEFVPWQEPNATPEVTLTLEVIEGGQPRVYRVRKLFGREARLEWSNNGESFNPDVSARQVDEKLRELLQWGVPAAGAGRGMPDSFLSKVLMASQPEVTGILAAALADDKDASGKRRIMGAMEAMLEDPLFKKVLDRAVQRVNTAFSATGRKRTGRGSPWIEVRDKINESEAEVTKLQTLREQSAAVLAKVRSLDDQVLLCEEAVSKAKQHLAQMTERWKQQAEMQALQARVDTAQATLDEQVEKLAAVERAKAAAAQLEDALSHKQAGAREAKVTVAEAQSLMFAAEQQVRQLEGADAVREAELKASKLRERQTKLQADIEAQTRNGELAQTVGKRHGQVTQLRAQVEQLTQSIGLMEAELQAQQSESDSSSQLHESLRSLARYWRHRDAEAQLQAAEAAERSAAVQQQQAQQDRERAESIETALAAQQLPDSGQLDALRRLHQQLELQQTALELGLTAVVTPDVPPLQVEVTADAAQAKVESLFLTSTFSARHSLKLKLPGATISLSAGAAQAVQELEVLRAKWQNQGEAALGAAGVSSLAELEQVVKAADSQRQECKELRRRASERETAAADLRPQAARIDELRERVESGQQGLASFDLPAMAERLGGFRSESELARAEADAERRRQQLQTSSAAKQANLQSQAAQLEAARSQLSAAQQAYRDAADRVDGEWQQRLAQVIELLKALQVEKKGIDSQLAHLSVAQNEELASAKEKLVSMQAALTAASEALEVAEQAVRTHEKDLAELRGGLKLLEERAQAADVDGARQLFEKVRLSFTQAQQAALAAGTLLTQSDLDAVVTQIEDLQARLEETRSERDRARGSLMEVGGNVVEEELQDARAALTLQKRELEELEVEYGAWQLLQITLREAEKAEATHLGERLGAPLQTRFSDLTDGRYARIHLGADLKTQGLIAAGELRDVGTLSAGTQEQLSTIFRLCLAEALETAVILDDHLSQTDSVKMQWFRAALDQVAQKTQVVVISCWPEHYQLPEGKVDTARKIDAVTVVERY